ncbi:hypothetical protein AHiyo1_49520 [Arthrobacter sp. Hiyo1]|nr:hypothetical protein AHiyo1_49520 [Arthrobacter sp. Hiyo1]
MTNSSTFYDPARWSGNRISAWSSSWRANSSYASARYLSPQHRAFPRQPAGRQHLFASWSSKSTATKPCSSMTIHPRSSRFPLTATLQPSLKPRDATWPSVSSSSPPPGVVPRKLLLTGPARRATAPVARLALLRSMRLQIGLTPRLFRQVVGSAVQ